MRYLTSAKLAPSSPVEGPSVRGWAADPVPVPAAPVVPAAARARAR